MRNSRRGNQARTTAYEERGGEGQGGLGGVGVTNLRDQELNGC